MGGPTSIQTKFLIIIIRLFKALPEEVIVCNFAERLAVSSAEGIRIRGA
jgi:hypothetical protein